MLIDIVAWGTAAFALLIGGYAVTVTISYGAAYGWTRGRHDALMKAFSQRKQSNEENGNG